MNKLQHIDDLLKKSAASVSTPDVGDQDWLYVERKLGRRKNRIYALWFFLALIVSSSIAIFVAQNSSQDPLQAAETTDTTQDITENKSAEETHDFTADTEINDNSVSEELQNGDISSSTPITSSTPFVEAQPTQEPPIPSGDVVDAPSYAIEEPVEEVIADIPVVKEVIEEEEVVVEEVTTEEPIIANTKPEKPQEPAIKPQTGTGNQNSNNTTGYWETGFSFTPSISSKLVSENSAFAGLIHKQYYDKVNSSENATFANSAGLNAQYHTSSGFYIATGFFITQRSEQINYNYRIDSTPWLNNNVIGDYIPVPFHLQEEVKLTGSNSYHFIEIPVNIGYKRAISPNFELRGQLGLSYLNLFKASGQKADYTYLELNDVNDLNLDNHNLASNVKLGVYLNKNRFVIGAEPTFSLNLNSLSETNAAIQVKPYNYGFNITTNYKLIKK